MSGKNRRKRYKMDKPPQRQYTKAEKLAWNTGYEDRKMQAAAIANGVGGASATTRRKPQRAKFRTGRS